MKIRIKGNSVRYRLTRPEVETFSKLGYLEEKTQFPSKTLTYALKAKTGIQHLEADLSGDSIVVYFPDQEKEKWYHSETVGYKHSLDLPGGTALGILIEKDFACIDKVDEDQSDNYPNPNMIC